MDYSSSDLRALPGNYQPQSLQQTCLFHVVTYKYNPIFFVLWPDYSIKKKHQAKMKHEVSFLQDVSQVEETGFNKLAVIIQETRARG